MARRGRTQEAEAETEATPDTQPEETEAAPNPEPTAESDEANTEQASAAEVDLTPFQEVVNAAVEQRDESTGELPEAAIQPVTAAYRELEGLKPKNAARSWVEDQMKQAIVGQNITLARAFVMVKDNLSAGTGRTERQPADPAEAFANRLVTFNLGQHLLTLMAPDEVDNVEKILRQAQDTTQSLADQAEEYLQWASQDEDERGDEPEVNPLVRAAYKLAQGKAAGGMTRTTNGGPRRDIGKHIEQVFAEKEPGSFLTVNEIAKARSTEYGDDRPSAGAVSARLFPRNEKLNLPDGIEPVGAGDGHPKGARKVAA